ncbi:hypothetical protein GH714_016500 [Hevea brasiliensis]|uniref:Uncharacterized protein n=1 Tax=Hevea brasiliensis TaxID=3981 RepID=A0A6A6MFE5_HEVBR|nr:hypothetical protein GH714_016500 [Hevea brasiliensis]
MPLSIDVKVTCSNSSHPLVVPLSVVPLPAPTAALDNPPQKKKDSDEMRCESEDGFGELEAAHPKMKRSQPDGRG